jgi:ribose/xylose/arabinose/galactoside ABC-type transport system permease subunit
MRADSERRPRRDWIGSPILWPILGLLLLFVFNLLFSPGFFRLKVLDGRLYGTLVDIFHQGSDVMLLAIGMTLVIATRGVDLSVGSIMAIAGAVAAALIKCADASLPTILAASLGLALLAGCFNGVLVAYAGIQPIIATLIFMVAGRGIAMLLTDGQIITFSHPSFDFVGNGHFLGLPFTITIVLGMLAVTLVATRRTAIGLFLESVGDNEKAARYCGINTKATKLLVYAFSGFCAGLAGLLATSNIKAADSSRVGEMLELDAIFAVVVGGTALTGGRFTLLGSLIGAVLIQTLTTTMLQFGVPPEIAPVPKAIVIVGVCLLQSARFRQRFAGLFSGKRARSEVAAPAQPTA